VIPTTAHVDNRPLYDTDPPEIPEGWHSFDGRSKASIAVYQGPFGSKVTLPRSLPLPHRVFSVGLEYKSRISAHRHAAFIAYRALYDAELLNEHLLPITSVVEPQLEDEVKALLQDVERRAGTANVTIQMDPWAPEDEGADCWRAYELEVDTLPPLQLFTRSKHIFLPGNKGPLLYRSGRAPLQCYITPTVTISLADPRIVQAREYTRRLFWSLNGSRMTWDNLDFSYLLLPVDLVKDLQWVARRAWLSQVNTSLGLSPADEYFANAENFGVKFSHPNDVTIVRNGFQFAKGFRFVRWRHETLSPEEEVELREYYSRFTDLKITYPLLVVEPLPPRTNFLISTPPRAEPAPEVKTLLLLPRLSAITLLSPADTEYAFLLPSILRSVSIALTADSLRNTLFTDSPLFDISLPLLIVATTSPASQEKNNYQRLETLGDTVLKFVVGIQLLAEYPLWHEGYLSRKKDHAVSNVRLAKEDIAKGVYRWIIRGIGQSFDRIKGCANCVSYRYHVGEKVEAQISH
jgi:endoribonuclease Dicer